MKKKYEQRHLELGKNRKLTVRIYRERRRSVRYYLGKNGGILRLPFLLSQEQENTYIRHFAEWLEKQIDRRPDLGCERQPRNYTHGEILHVGQRQYELSIQYGDRQSHTGRLAAGKIHLHLSRQAAEESLHKDIPTLLSRLIARDFLPQISRRVDELNDRFFQQDIGQIRLKYTHTVWGSCSRQRNLNLSTRLLFAPPNVIDYVIIHELAHLIEMNHSKKFWRLVEQAMPNYREQEKWLKDNGHLCRF